LRKKKKQDPARDSLRRFGGDPISGEKKGEENESSS